MNVEEQEKRLLDYKWHERRYSKDTCYILSTQGTEEPNYSYFPKIAQKRLNFHSCNKFMFLHMGNVNF